MQELALLRSSLVSLPEGQRAKFLLTLNETELEALDNDWELWEGERVWEEPEWFIREVLGCEAYEQQLEMIRSVRDYAQTTVNGANGVGKDWMIGRVVCWWMAAHAAEPSCKVIVTGPTYRQIADIVWRETRDAFNSSTRPLTGRMLPTAARWEVGDQYFALGFSTDRAWNITGFHDPNLLVVVSEAHNVDEAVYVALKRLHPSRLLLSGNPFAQSGEFFESHTAKRHLYRAITITAADTPNIDVLEYEVDDETKQRKIKRIEGEDRVPGVVTVDDVKRMAEDWGADSPFYRATVDAEFAETEDGLIGLKYILAAAKDALDDGVSKITAGLDVAGPGEDETVLTFRQNDNVIGQWYWREPDPRGAVVALLNGVRDRLESVNVDSNGIGWGIALHLGDQGFTVRFVNVGTSPRNDRLFVNLKAELYWGLRLWFMAGSMRGVVDDVAQSQLASIRYGHNARGQIQIERKEDAKKRGIKSPDRAESIMLAFAWGGGSASTSDLNDQFRGNRNEAGEPTTVEEVDRRADAEHVETVYTKEF